MNAARFFGVQCAFAAGVALVAFAVGEQAWFAGAAIAAAVAGILAGLADAIARPEGGQERRTVMSRSTPSFGVERVITSAPPIAIERWPRNQFDDGLRPIWPTDTGAPE